MTAAISDIFVDLLNPVRLTGPVFDKELRVSSRRRRNYVLRFGYIALLSVFFLSVWFSTMRTGGSATALYKMSRLPELGKITTIVIVWLQFVTAQLIAMVMLSSSMSDEVHAGTLAVLMTTPISNFQIVIGKLLSKLLQLILLLTISLPLLAIIRIFGGVPWDYLMASVCITLTAAVFAGTMSLLLSMIYRYAHKVIIVLLVGYMIIFGALPGLVSWLAAEGVFNQQNTHLFLAKINPFWAIAAMTQGLSTPSVSQNFSWQMHCLSMLGATAIVLSIAVWRVKKAAVGQMTVRGGRFRFGGIKGDSQNNPSSCTSGGSITRIKGSPIVWKEMRKGINIRTGKGFLKSALFAVVFIILLLPVLFSSRKTLGISSFFMSGIFLIAMLRLAVFSAGGIAGEKESRTWPIFLATPLEDRRIIRDKAIAAFRRCFPLLLLYCVSTIIFLIRINNPKSLITLPAAILGSILFMIGLGLYFGVRFRTSNAAIAATIGSFIVLEFLFGIVFNIFFTRLIVARISGPGGMVWISLITTIIQRIILGGIGIFFMLLAVRRMRHDIF